MLNKQGSAPAQGYKTEDHLKAEAKARREAELKRMAACPPDPAAQKRENFWYHYKWHTIVIILFVIILSFFTKDLFFRTKPDATIIMVSRQYYPQESLDDLARALELAAADFNGDKKVSILVDSILLPSGGEQQEDAGAVMNGQQEYASSVKLFSVVAAASDPIYLLDSEAYACMMDMAGEDSIFIPDSVSASGLAFQDAQNAELFSAMRFYLRDAALREKNPAYYRYCEALLQSIAALVQHP